MKQLLLITILLLSTNLFATEETKVVTKKKDWTKIRDVIKTTIEKSKRSEQLSFNAPVFRVSSSVELDSHYVTGATF